MPFPCNQCQAMTINGVPCHETGCPDAWKDYDRACFECGCPFRPESPNEAVCPDCANPVEDDQEAAAEFVVWSLDVWGNEEDGFEVNDRCKVGIIELDADLIFSSHYDKEIMCALERAGFLKPGSHEYGSVDGESDHTLYIDGHDGRPWLQLERVTE